MRNFLKPAARTARSRARRSVRGFSAVIASVALAAGLGAHPVDAQETETVTATTTADSSTSPAESTTTNPVVAEPNSVTVERMGTIDRITVRDTDDNPWGSGRKASDEFIWGVKRVGDGDITRIVSVTADGQELDPQYFGFVNGQDSDVIGIDEDAFSTIPPTKLEIEAETTAAGEYEIAEPEEVPTARELSATGFGQTDQAAATVVPDGVGMARAATQPNSTEQLTLNGLSYSLISGASGGKPPRIRLETKVGGTFEQRNFYLTELVIKFNSSTSTAVQGPVTVRKNVDPGCTIQPTDIKPVSMRTGSGISVNLTSCRIAVWKGSGDNIQIDFFGPGANPRNVPYTVELYGAYDPTTSPEPPAPDTPACRAPEGRRPARGLSDGEKADGTTVFVSHSPNATGIGSRTTTRLSRQIQGKENFSTLSESRWVYNALAYNRADNWLYAVSQRSDDPNNAEACPPGYLLQINPETGEVHNIGRILRSGTDQSPFAKNDRVNDLDYLNTGWIGYNGGVRLYVANSSTSGSRAVYKVTLPAVGESNPQSSSPANTASVYAEDHALLFDPNEQHPSKDPYAQYSWGLVSPAGVRALGYPEGTLLMERYNVATNRVDRFVIDNPQTVGGKQVPTGKIWGKAWTYGNGNLGFGTGGQFYSNQSIQIKVDDPLSRSPKFTIVSVVENAPASFNTDGTSNAPMPVPPVDLAVEKVALDAGNDAQYGNALATLKKLNSRDSVTTRYWAVVVRNLSDGSSTGFTVTDQIPSVYDQNTIRGYSELSGQWDEFNVTRDYPEPGVASVEFNSGRLAGKSQRTFYFSAELKAGEECEVNTVAIRGNEVDQVPNNNEGSDLCSNDGVRVRLAKVDADNIDGVPADDAFLPDAQFRIDRLDRNSSVQLIRDADGFFALPEDLTPVGGLEGGLAPGEYQIVETKSPSGYSLLTAPIKFRVNAVESDERLTFDAANSAGYARVVSELSTDNDVVVAVGDVRQGNMPKTGGAGLQLPILFGGILIAAGALMGRRNVAA